MARAQKIPTAEDIFQRFEKGHSFNSSIGLYDQVKVNEDFFIGNQWEGVQANGLPTPTYNIFKQVINFQVSTITSDNMAIQSTPMAALSPYTMRQMEQVCEIVNRQISAIMERNKITTLNREFLRNAAVTGDGCIHYFFDPDVENGQKVKGEIRAELVDNLRVIFGNPNCRDVQRQPYIILTRRDTLDDLRWYVEDLQEMGRKEGETLTKVTDLDAITADSEQFENTYDSYTDDKATVFTYYFRNRKTKTIWCMESTQTLVVREAYDTGLSLYPIVWLNWDYIRDCYHGQAMITGLIPNQKFINKMFALVGISLLTTSFPKYIYDRTKITRWSGDVGSAIGVTGAVDGAAKVIEGASVSPQIAQFIELSFNKTRSLLGASDVAMGDSRPDNTSAIIALQRAANTPMELTKQNDYQCMEDSAKIWLDMMATYYGERMVEVSMEMDKQGEQPLGMQLAPQNFMIPFDFGQLKGLQLDIKLDVGGSSYWSEMANMQTLDNLFMNGHIDAVQYLERVPNGYLTKKQELIEELKAQQMPPALGPQGTGMSMETTSSEIPVQGGPGNSQLQRALNREGA